MRRTMAALGAAVLALSPLGPVAAKSATMQYPCDIYANAGTPCVAANSTVRALYASYNGPLYTVTRSDGKTDTINTTGPGGYADSLEQDRFCSGYICTITDIADQSGYYNDLASPAPAGGYGQADQPADAQALPVYMNGHKVYGVLITPGIGYYDDLTQYIPTGSQAQTAYEVAGDLTNSGCCFDYGNAEVNRQDNGAGHMEALNFEFGGILQVDVENASYGGPRILNQYNSLFESSDGTSSFTLRAANAQGGSLTSYTKPLPAGWAPLHLEGGMVLGTGGDNSNYGAGEFYEGAIIAGQSTPATDAAVQAAIVSAGYTTRTPSQL